MSSETCLRRYSINFRLISSQYFCIALYNIDFKYFIFVMSLLVCIYLFGSWYFCFCGGI